MLWRYGSSCGNWLLPDAAELAEAAERPRRVQAPAVHRVRDLAHVQVALRVHAEAVRRDELRRPVPDHRVADAGQALAVAVVRVEAVAHLRVVGELRVHEHLADVDDALA